MPKELRDLFLSQLATPLVSEKLFAHVPDIVFCIKNINGQYISANRAFADRLGLSSHQDILGKTASDLFPNYLATIYDEQDNIVFHSGDEIVDQLELVSKRDGGIGWHLASKLPLRGKSGEIIGLASISRDLLTPGSEDLKFAGLARTVDFIQKNYAEDLKLSEMAAKINLSTTQLDRRMKKIFKLSTSQFIRKVRIGAATNMLMNSNKSVSEIAHSCGYSDQSAFTRQFKATVGMAPGQFRTQNSRSEVKG